MTDQIAGALSTLITAIATAILMAAAYYWGPGKRQDRKRKRESDQDDEYEERYGHRPTRHYWDDSDDDAR